MLTLVDKAFQHHTAQHIALPVPGGLRVGEGIDARGRLRRGGQHSALSQVQFTHMLAEVGAGRRFHSISAVPEEHLVKIHVQYIVFAEVALQPVRQDSFLELAYVAAFRGKQQALDQLLGDGAAALCPGAALQIVYESADYGFGINAVMLVEAGILSGQKSPGQHGRHVGQVHQKAFFII